ncbi:RDD family protein [Longispora albida]|uniref:RDD family protein n=1 Tax=Longispora albida TaxID=203523 RepID=UPI000375893B|nr:RDD family protein [Longispora albida]
MELASLNQRFGALLVDWLLCMLIVWPLSEPGWMGTWALAVLVAVYAFFVGLYAQTPGMRLIGIRCVNADTGGPLGIPRAAFRGVLLALLVPAIVMDSYGRGWHDRWSGSVVTRVKPSE